MLAVAVAAAPAAAADEGPALRAGAARADITPPTGYPLLGWARGEARALGQHTRLFARALVLGRGSLASRPFRLHPSATLRATIARTRDTAIVHLFYPAAAPERDFTARPQRVVSGSATVHVRGRRVTVRIRDGAGTVAAPASARVTLVAARDRFGNHPAGGADPADRLQVFGWI